MTEEMTATVADGDIGLTWMGSDYNEASRIGCSQDAFQVSTYKSDALTKIVKEEVKIAVERAIGKHPKLCS